MKKRYKHIAFFLFPFWIGVILLFSRPVDKKFSYQFVKGECNNRASWIYNRIFENKKETDIVFLGASQTGCAIMDEYIETAINKNSKNELSVVNLGYCRRGRDVQYTILKDVFEHKNPKLLFVEVPEDEPKKSHPVFPYLASTSELMSSFVWFNQRYFSNLWKGLTVRFEFLRHRIFTSGTCESGSYTDFGYIPYKYTANKDLIEGSKLLWKRKRAQQKSLLYRNHELNYSKIYVKKITELAAANNCKLFFVYLRESGSNMKYPYLHSYYNELGELILLPEVIFSNYNNWKDAAHFNDFGAKEASAFLADLITTSFTPEIL